MEVARIDEAAFCAEQDQLLVTGLQVSPLITVDDSGARHQGHNGYVTQIGTQIGNAWFVWFSSTSSTSSKSRINFLELLHTGDIGCAGCMPSGWSIN